jgi:phosphatidylserine/phosphatidylglycerophosphate/cardiolipin synthase-like enzyme
MAAASKQKGAFSVTAYQGDAKTLLAFNLDKANAKNLAGFSILCQPDDKPAYYLQNKLRFETPAKHAQDPKEPANSSVNAPIHKFRWLHVPGLVHQGLTPFMGKYTYTVTPRYFDAAGSMLPLDRKLGLAVDVDVVPFEKKGLRLGFTRGFTQSQAFVYHFGRNARIVPKDGELVFETSAEAGANANGEHYTFADAYGWLGFTARERIFELLNEVAASRKLHLDMFAYDLTEPDMIKLLLKLAGEGRIRIILDNAALHHSSGNSKPEDEFEALFTKAAKKGAEILRGKFGRYAHDKVLIVSDRDGPKKVLTGSTNFSVTGLYVNSNHVLIFDKTDVAQKYQDVFDAAWKGNVKKAAFLESELSGQTFSFSKGKTPKTDITFAPHTPEVAGGILRSIADRIEEEGKKSKGQGSVLFAVMQMDQGESPVYKVLNNLHNEQTVFSYGVSDGPEGISLYKPGMPSGILVTGKPRNTQLPPPFNQVPNIQGVGHQIHHKFVVCGFNGENPVVYCGSSNLAAGGEENNGDNLLAIHDGDVATAFAIEAMALVDHFEFLDKYSRPAEGKTRALPTADERHAAVDAKWFLPETDRWTKPYFDPNDLHNMDRELFGGAGN